MIFSDTWGLVAHGQTVDVIAAACDSLGSQLLGIECKVDDGLIAGLAIVIESLSLQTDHTLGEVGMGEQVESAFVNLIEDDLDN